jgi:purine-binding chemotaxis protein CheW
MVSVRQPRATSGKNLVGFEVSGVTYAIEIGRVREIMRPLPTLTLPALPAGVIGVVDHRGDVVPVIDLRVRFGVSPSGLPRDERWVIVRSGARPFGLAVDRVIDVFAARESESREIPAIGNGEAARAIRGVYVYRGRLVFVLDVDPLTSLAERLELPSAAALQRGVDGSG